MPYTYEQALEESTKYFNGNGLSAKVFVDKYALRDNDNNILESTPEQMHRRLAKEFARIEKKKFKNPLSEDEIFLYLDRFKYIIPQGSPMYGIGNPYQYVSIGNCFVIPPPLDSYLGIMYTDTEITQISCRRGGVGWDVSNLRPKNSAVQNAAKTTSGCIEFMKRFSNTIREIGQHGRRGASLQSIHVSHPDIIEFINIKKNLTEVTGSNISVKFTDKFFEALEKDSELELKWPVDSKNPKISRKIKAKEIWDAFISSAWEMAEPGAMFIDNVYKYSTTYPYREFGFYETSSNPCQPGWAKLLTRAGIRQLSQVNIGDEIWSKDGWTKILNKWSNGVKKVYKYTTTSGVFYGTKNHKIISNGQKVKVEIANSIDIITGEYHSNIKLDDQVIMDGLVLGDGGIHKASNNLVILYIGEDDSDYFDSGISKYIIKHRPGISNDAYEIKTGIKSEELVHTYNRKVPVRYLYGNRDVVCSFLRGLYSANGSACDNRITLKSSSIEIIESAQMMLSSLGIRSYYTTNKPSSVQFANGNYLCKQSYDLNITTDRNKFVNLIGFIQQYKNDKIKIVKSCSKKKTYDIISVDFVSEEEVFDITVDNNSHTYWTQCCNVSNCGEQYLPNYASCRLIAINLLSFVNNPFEQNAEFDWQLFKNTVSVMQRLADDMVDLELEAIEKIINKIKSDPEPDNIKSIGIQTWESIKDCTIKDRRTGCGLTALGDTIAALGMQYCSEESLDFAEEMQKQFKLSAFSSSVDMAKELGPFPLYDYNLDKTSEFIKQIKIEDDDLYNRMKKYGRRNMTLLTIAPTGSVSILTQTTSGIEPVFMLKYKRRKKGNPGDKGFRTDFTDKNNDHWMEFDVYHTMFQKWKDITGLIEVEDSPYKKSSSHEIDYIKRVELQARLQKNIDNSISTTINLPNDIGKDKVSDIYLMAYKLGCKGMTIYRDGSRTGVLVKDDGPKIPKTIAPERPKDLTCDVHHVTVKGKPYFVLVGLFQDGSPYEVFAGKNGHIDPKIKKGIITHKLKPKCYKAVLEDDTEISPVTIACDENEEALTRMVSTALRHGAETKFIVEQLSKVSGDMNIFAKALSRALKHYISNGDTSDEKCPTCESTLVYQEGCKICCSCGFSKCS